MNITKVQDGKKAYDVLTIEGSFDKAYPALKNEGVEIASAEQIAKVRRLSRADSSLSRNYGQWVAEAHVYQPKESGIVLIVDGKHNPILANPTEATNAHRQGNEFYVDASKLANLAEKDLKKAVKSGVLALARPKGEILSSAPNPFEVSVDELAENPYFAFTLRNEAKAYGQFLKSAGIKSVPVYLVNEANTKKESNPFARLLWVGSLDGRSVFLGDDGGLGYGVDRVRGVRSSASAVSASTQKSRELTYSQIMKAVRPVVAKRNQRQLEDRVTRLFSR